MILDIAQSLCMFLASFWRKNHPKNGNDTLRASSPERHDTWTARNRWDFAKQQDHGCETLENCNIFLATGLNFRFSSKSSFKFWNRFNCQGTERQTCRQSQMINKTQTAGNVRNHSNKLGKWVIDFAIPWSYSRRHSGQLCFMAKICDLQHTAGWSKWPKAFCKPYSVRTHNTRNLFYPSSNMQKKAVLQLIREPWIFPIILANRKFLKITSGMQRHSLLTSIKCILFQQNYGRQFNHGESTGKFLNTTLWTINTH